MLVHFYVDDIPVDYCDQVAIPRVGDTVTIETMTYNVLSVNWNYDTRGIRIKLERIE